MAERADVVPLCFDTHEVFCYICRGLMGALLGFGKRGNITHGGIPPRTAAAPGTR